MAEKITELENIAACISRRENFLLSGGAGSGKTYSLVEVLKGIFQQNPTAKVGCITYTNVAVNQINDRIRFSNLKVSTIHEFLWENIKSFQKDLKLSLIELIREGKISDSSGEVTGDEYFNGIAIDYKEWRKIKDGVVSHDEVLILAEKLFSKFPKLADILIDKYDFILIDEYQDTAPEVISILLTHIQKSKKKNIIGFFGDSMQSIYPDTIGDIKQFVDSGTVKEVIKQDNRRNPEVVINLANQLRTDAVKQKPAEDESAPNYKVQGDIKFLYSDASDIEAIKKTDYFKGWDFSDSKETKELYLTHNLIAPRAGFSSLMEIYARDRILEFKRDIVQHIKDNGITIDPDATFGDVIDQIGIAPTGVKAQFILANPTLYSEARAFKFEEFRKIYIDKDQLIGNKKGTEEEERKRGTKRDALIRHLFHIQECIYFYESGLFNDFIRISGFKVTSIADKEELKEAIDKLKNMKENTIEEVIDFADQNRIWSKDDKLTEFIAENEYVWNRVKKVKYQELCNLYDFVEGFTPYSTQHNIKGAEFDNVFVVLDNGRWNDYNFKNLFLGTGTDTVLKRTQKIFYVCCTRTKRNLVVFFHKPETGVIAKAKTWFGEKNVIKI